MWWSMLDEKFNIQLITPDDGVIKKKIKKKKIKLPFSDISIGSYDKSHKSSSTEQTQKCLKNKKPNKNHTKHTTRFALSTQMEICISCTTVNIRKNNHKICWKVLNFGIMSCILNDC